VLPPLRGTAADARAPDELGLPQLVGRLVDDAKGVARAEMAAVKARVAERAQAYQGAAIFFGAAAVLALAALIALLVGLILTLATLVGPGWATLIVVAAVLAVAGVLAWIGSRRLRPPPALPEGS
jgi:hypothetical protein